MVLFKAEKDTLTAYLGGDIDHHTSKNIRDAIDSEIYRLMPSVLKLDFRDVNFMDSSGVGLVMGRYRNLQKSGAQMHITNIPQGIYKVMKLAGMERLAQLEKGE